MITTKTVRIGILTLATLALLSACDREERLAGDREAIRENQEAVASADQVVALKLPAPQNVASWTHKNGDATHRVRHLALSQNLTRIWGQSIGSGNKKRLRITSDPIIADGRIFTLDSNAGVRAFSTGGAALWSRNLTPASERKSNATGGGLAYGNGVLMATTGYGEVIALSPDAGKILWRHKADAAISSAPVITGNTVVAISRNNTALGLDLRDGRIQWQQQSPAGDPGLIGGANPAASGRLVVLPFASGELVGALSANGFRAWSIAVTGGRRGLARGFVGDISGDPVIDGRVVYAGNQSGRLAALDRRSGERLWTANDGAYGPVWPEGGSVFVVTDESKLKRLSAADGSVIWSTDLPQFRKAKKRANAFVHYGPIMAGGRLIVASSDGQMRSFDPTTGAQVSSVALSGGAASQPAIVNGVLYILTGNGQLQAFK